MRFFKIVYGYQEHEFIPIIGDELPKAIALFMEKTGRGSFQMGGIDARDIKRVVPDWHRAMGWNAGWKMTADDFRAIRSIEPEYRNTYARAEEIAKYAISKNRMDLLELPATVATKEVPKILKGNGVVDTASLALKFKLPPKK